MNVPADGPRVQRAGSQISIDLPGEDTPYRVLSWQPPRLLLAQGEIVHALFLAPDAGGNGCWVGQLGCALHVARESSRATHAASAHGHDDLTAPMPGKVLALLVEEGQTVAAGARLVVIEAMKMEHTLRAPHASVVTRVHVTAGASVALGERLLELDQVEEPSTDGPTPSAGATGAGATGAGASGAGATTSSRPGPSDPAS